VSTGMYELVENYVLGVAKERC